MWYEIFLRLRAPDPAAATALREGLAAEPGVERASAGLRVTLPEGELTLAWQPEDPAAWAASDAPGVDVRVPGGSSMGLAAAACDQIFQWAERYGLVVYDPQLGRTVTSRDAEGIQARMGRLADYLTDTVGIDDGAAARHIDVDAPQRGLSLRTRFYLGLAVVLGLLLLAARYCGSV